MKASHKRVIEALRSGCTLSRSTLERGVYLLRRWPDYVSKVSYKVIWEMRDLGLIDLEGKIQPPPEDPQPALPSTGDDNALS